ncbi:hypothetical protein AV530_000769 [Patagioenas fasciata monilis]|uniref:Uncharacterized protein n=1 Tax=Patagioenas fasciata monilis TaxID=372326 RepID=A0A1V4KS68_PATFA|nr:hypothetical protein AV530_000769 [Patagioenas fasciata monilis]
MSGGVWRTLEDPILHRQRVFRAEMLLCRVGSSISNAVGCSFGRCCDGSPRGPSDVPGRAALTRRAFSSRRFENEAMISLVFNEPAGQCERFSCRA